LEAIENNDSVQRENFFLYPMKSSFNNLMGIVLAQGQGFKNENIRSQIMKESE
tara:strand:- start:633 stop:791 length:159 start_codon:yes stop_codon:yes gene_type:complete